MLIKTNQLLPNTAVSITVDHMKPTPLAVAKNGQWRLHLKYMDDFEPAGYIETPMDDDGYVCIWVVIFNLLVTPGEGDLCEIEL